MKAQKNPQLSLRAHKLTCPMCLIIISNRVINLRDLCVGYKQNIYYQLKNKTKL